MLRFLMLFACTLFVGNAFAHEDPTKAPPEPENMQSIFNGKDLTGWEGDSRLWSVKDGAIRGETTAENRARGNTFLVWKDGQTKDFELRLSFRCNATNNSGIQYRSRHIAEDRVRNPWVVRGYQHEIRNQHDFPNVAGFIYDEGGGRGRMCLVGEKVVWTTEGKKVEEKFLDEDGYKKLFKLNDWNDVVIIAQGKHIRHYLNDRLIVDFTDDHPERALREGILALQLHAGSPMWVEFKNLRIKHLASSPVDSAAVIDRKTAQQLVDRAIQAMGGNKALEKSRNTVIEDEGTYYGMGAGVPYKGRYVYSMTPPGRFRMEIIDQFVSVTDGDKAWISVMGMTMELDGEALEVAKQGVLVNYAMSLIPLQKPNKEFKLTLTDGETVDGEECQGVKIEHEKMPALTLQFSNNSGLIKKSKFVNKAAELGFQKVTEEAVFHEYKEFDGFKSPTKMTMYRDGKKFVESNPQKVTFPDAIDESEFKKPE